MSDYTATLETKSQGQQRFAIVNGDDFGFSQGVNQAILMAHKQGILTSTSLMIAGDASEAAIALAKAYPSLGVGLHLVTICGRAILPPDQIPHLVDRLGQFSTSPIQAGLKYQFNAAARHELQLEIRAQLEAFRQTGLPLSHVDGHLHMHCHPVILNILIDLAQEFDIRVIRLPFEELSLTLQCDRSQVWSKAINWLVFSQLRRYGESRLNAAGVRYTDRVYGLLRTGQMTEAYLNALVPKIQANYIEIYAHPAIPLPGELLNGPLGSGPKELDALLSQQVKETLLNSGLALTNFVHLR
jgi:chitin disaccharide deacetylase